MWERVITFLIVGYLTCGRSFAYIGIPPMHLFIGEVVLAGLILIHTRETIDRWVDSISRPGPLHTLGIALLFFMADGVLELLRGLSLGFSPLAALVNLVFNVYPLYLFAGLWIGSRDPDIAQRTIRILAWTNGVYGLLYIVSLHQLTYVIPGTYPEIAVFGQPSGSAIALLGLLCFEEDLARHWLLLGLNCFVLLGIQVRAEFLGTIVGLVVWGILKRRIGRVVAIAGVLATLLAIGFLADFSIPAPETRGGKISAKYIVGRMVAPFDEQLAEELTPIAEGNAGTARWRTEWWKAIWRTTYGDATTAAFGRGYGFPLSSLVPYIKGEVVRTPHNAFFYALGYSGWIGVAATSAFQLALGGLLWQAYRTTGQPFGLVVWATFLCVALFGNLLETPFGAIPLYLLTGLAAAPAQVRQEIQYAYLSRPQLLSATWR